MKKLAPNKATNDLNWETGKAWTSLSIDSPWQLGSVQDRHIITWLDLPNPWTLSPPMAGLTCLLLMTGLDYVRIYSHSFSTLQMHYDQYLSTPDGAIGGCACC